MKKTILSIAVLAILATSCEKTIEKKPDSPTFTEAKLAGNYKVTATSIISTPVNNENVFNNSDEELNIHQPCEQDDLHKLHLNMTYQREEGNVACATNTTGENRGTGTWSLSGNIIYMNGVTCIIHSFDGKNLVLYTHFQDKKVKAIYERQ